MLRRRLDGVDSLLTVSNHITRKCRREFPSIADRCETVYCGIDPKEFPASRTILRPRHEGRNGLYTGAISPHKGIHVLVDAFNLVARRHTDVRLDLVGNPMSYPIEESFDMNDREKVKSVPPLYAKQHLERVKAKLSLAPCDAGTYQAHLKGDWQRRFAPRLAFEAISASERSWSTHTTTQTSSASHLFGRRVLAFHRWRPWQQAHRC